METPLPPYRRIESDKDERAAMPAAQAKRVMTAVRRGTELRTLFRGGRGVSMTQFTDPEAWCTRYAVETWDRQGHKETWDYSSHEAAEADYETALEVLHLVPKQ